MRIADVPDAGEPAMVQVASRPPRRSASAATPHTDIYLAAVDWDGREPIRRDGFVNR